MGLRKRISPDIVSYEAELDEKLQEFFAEVRKKDGSDYEPDSLPVMLASLDRHLKEAGSSTSIAKDTLYTLLHTFISFLIKKVKVKLTCR